MRLARMWAFGPITASCAMTVGPSRIDQGSMRASCPISTAASIRVVAGSTTVTPLRMCASTMRLRMRSSAAARATRSLMPIVSAASSASTMRTDRPSATAMATRSVRYSSPDDEGVTRPSAAAQPGRVERVGADVDLVHGARELVGVRLLDDRAAPPSVRARPGHSRSASARRAETSTTAGSPTSRSSRTARNRVHGWSGASPMVTSTVAVSAGTRPHAGPDGVGRPPLGLLAGGRRRERRPPPRPHRHRGR